jgi:hypothetical protein
VFSNCSQITPPRMRSVRSRCWWVCHVAMSTLVLDLAAQLNS